MEQESGRADSEDEEFFDPSEASPARTGSSPGRPLSRRLSSAETSFHDADEAIPGQQPVYGYLHELVNAHRIGLPTVCQEPPSMDSKCQYRVTACCWMTNRLVTVAAFVGMNTCLHCKALSPVHSIQRVLVPSRADGPILARPLWLELGIPLSGGSQHVFIYTSFAQSHSDGFLKHRCAFCRGRGKAHCVPASSDRPPNMCIRPHSAGAALSAASGALADDGLPKPEQFQAWTLDFQIIKPASPLYAGANCLPLECSRRCVVMR